MSPRYLNFYDEVEDLTPLEIAVLCKRPDQIRWLLRSGNVRDVELKNDSIDDLIAMLEKYPSPWGRFAKPVDPVRVKETERLLRAAGRMWSPSTHALFHEGVRQAIVTIFHVAGRITSRDVAVVAAGGQQHFRLPIMPAECWMHIASFVCRKHWRATL